MMKYLLLSLLMFGKIRNQIVCSLEELHEELKEDLADNGRLDCKRFLLPPFYIN